MELGKHLIAVKHWSKYFQILIIIVSQNFFNLLFLWTSLMTE